MVKFCLLIGFTLLDAVLHAQPNLDPKNNSRQLTLSGKITDAKTGEPLPGASIYIADEKMGAGANNEGRYSFSTLSSGHHIIEVSHTGYSSIIEHIDIDKNSEKDYALTPSVVENQGVVITGVANATSIRKAPIPVISIRRAEILQTPATNIIDLLARHPGVSQQSTGPGISKPIIRGLGYNRVVVINDGVRQEGQQWGDEHGIEIDELSVNRAEILKGPASLMYGSDAIAGVINLITNVPVSEGMIKANILSNYQTNNRLYGLNGNVAGNINGINWNAYGTYKSAGDYKNKFDGRVLNSRFNERNFGGYIGLNKRWGFSHLIFSSFDQRLGLVEGDRDDATGEFLLFAGSPLERIATKADLKSRQPFVPMQHIKHYKLISDNSFSFGRSRLKLNAGFQNNQRMEIADPENPEEVELFFDMNTFTYNTQFVLPEMKEWHTTIGVSGMYQTSKNKAEEVLIPEYNLFDIGGFVFVQRFFKKVTLSGGARYDNRSIDSKEFIEGIDVKFVPFTRSFSNFSGSIGLTYEPSDFITVKANIARGFRAPNMAELGSNGVHEGTFRYEYGDNELKSETSLQLDGGLQVDYEHLSLGMSVFYNRINHFIFYRKLESVAGGDSLVNVDGEDVPAFQFNQRNAELSGIEVNLDFHPHPLDWLHFENSVSFVRGRFNEKIDGTDNLPSIPAPKLQSELRADFRKAGKIFQNLYLSFGMDWWFTQDKPFFAFNTETATPAYTLWNAGIGTDFISKKGNTILSVHLSGLNLTNAAYQNHLSRLKYADLNMISGRRGVFNTGRNFSLKINIPLNLIPHMREKI